MQKFNQNKFCDRLLILLTVIVITYSTWLALLYASQPPLDIFKFRQTQTALTAYWFAHDGFRFAYETPVAGAPWSIPFEFPIYQFLVALISKMIGFSLDVVGRVTSYCFLLLCLIPVKSITKNLQLPVSVFYIFVVILFSTPIYIYYGRAFMIETAALFFAIAGIKYFIDILSGKLTVRHTFLYVAFITLSILQKATTGLPVLAILSVAFLVFEVKKVKSIGGFIFSKTSLMSLVYFAIPLLVGICWVVYSDHVKLLNPLGQSLTSSALADWNWGTLEQRFSAELYTKVLWGRIFVENLAGIFGASLLLLALYLKSNKLPKIVIISSIALGVLPLFLFTNLHLVHSYYQSANIIFLVYAMAVALGGVIAPILGIKLIFPSLFIILISNYIAFVSNYLPAMKEVFKKDNRDYAVGEILKRELPEGDEFVAFGNDWSSTLAYMSQRKSFTVPEWFKDYRAVASHPENFVENGHLGAVVACSIERPSIAGLIDWSLDNKTWKIGETNGCYIVTPQKEVNLNDLQQVPCQGSIDIAGVEARGGEKVIAFAGWVATPGKGPIIPDRSFMVLTGPDGKTIYLENLKIPRLDVNSSLEIPNEIDAGFSRIISDNLPVGTYDVGIAKSKGDHFEICNIHKQMVVSGK